MHAYGILAQLRAVRAATADRGGHSCLVTGRRLSSPVIARSSKQRPWAHGAQITNAAMRVVTHISVAAPRPCARGRRRPTLIVSAQASEAADGGGSCPFVAPPHRKRPMMRELNMTLDPSIVQAREHQSGQPPLPLLRRLSQHCVPRLPVIKLASRVAHRPRFSRAMALPAGTG